MKKRLVAILALSALLSGCSDESTYVDKSLYEQALSQKDEYVKKLEKKEQELSEVEKELESVRKEYDAYQEEMKPYEEMSLAQAEAEKAKAERELKKIEEKEKKEQEKKEAEEKAKEESEKAAAEEEEKIGYDTGITYDQLARTPDEYEGKKVKFYGKVIQVTEGNSYTQIRFAVDEDYDKIILAIYRSSIITSRVLEDDKITIYGTSKGLETYTTVLGSSVTIPYVLIDKIDQ